MYGFKPLKISKLFMGFLALSIVILLTMISGNVFFDNLLEKQTAGEAVTEIESKFMLLFKDYAGISELILFAIIYLILVAWFFRAYKNLKALGANDIVVSPTVASLTFFVPGVNLIAPIMFFQKIWQWSWYYVNRGRSSHLRPNFLLPASWWILFIFVNILVIYSSYQLVYNSPEAIASSTLSLNFWSDIVFAVYLLIGIITVYKVYGWQEVKAKEIQSEMVFLSNNDAQNANAKILEYEKLYSDYRKTKF